MTEDSLRLITRRLDHLTGRHIQDSSRNKKFMIQKWSKNEWSNERKIPIWIIIFRKLLFMNGPAQKCCCCCCCCCVQEMMSGWRHNLMADAPGAVSVSDVIGTEFAIVMPTLIHLSFQSNIRPVVYAAIFFLGFFFFQMMIINEIYHGIRTDSVRPDPIDWEYFKCNQSEKCCIHWS